MICNIENALGPTKIRRIHDAYKKHATKSSQPRMVRYITDASQICEVKEVAEDVLQRVQPLVNLNKPQIGETFGTCTFVNAPHGENIHQSWHRDTTYLSYVAIIPLVNINKKNGCTEIIPDSTTLQPRQWRKGASAIQSVELNVGDILLFDGRLLHRGTANTSNRDRPVLILTITEFNIAYVQELPIFDTHGTLTR